MNPNLHLITSVLKPFLRTNTIKEKDLHKIKSLVDALFMIMPFPCYNIMPAQLHRLVLNENISDIGRNRIENITYVKYPPEIRVTKFGRCNCINQSILYGGFNFLTVMIEMKPVPGQLVTHSEWKLKSKKPLRMFPIFFLTNLQDDPHNALSSEIKMHHDNFTNSLNPSENFLSAYISKKIFDSTVNYYDGIIYPSVENRLGLSNMAIRPEVFDEKFDLVNISHSINMGHFNDVICNTKNFDLSTGKIMRPV